MIQKKSIFLASFMMLIMFGLVFLSSCGKVEKVADKKAEEPNVIKIGVLGPFSGEGATYGEAMKMGIEIAIERLNTDSPLKFKAIYRDSKMTPEDAINAFNYLVNSENIPVILGAAGSSISLALLPLANEKKVILLSSISTADNLSIENDYFFRNIPPNKNQAKPAADFLKHKLLKETVTILYENNDYGINMEKIFTDSFTAVGGKINESLSYESGQTDFNSLLAKIKQNEPDAVFIPGTYREVALIIKQTREMGIKSSLISGDGAYSPEVINIAGVAAEGFYCTLMGLPNVESNPELKEFAETFKAKHNIEPNVYSAYSYDAMFFVHKAFGICLKENQGSYTGEALSKIFYNISHPGIVGKMAFNKFGEVDSPYIIYQIKNGKFTPVKPE